MITVPIDYPNDVPVDLNVVTLRVWRDESVSVEARHRDGAYPDVVIGIDGGLEHTALAAVARDGQRYRVVGTLYLHTGPTRRLTTTQDVPHRTRRITSVARLFVEFPGWYPVHVCAEAWTFRKGQPVTSQSLATSRINGTIQGLAMGTNQAVTWSEPTTLEIKKRIGVRPSRNGDAKKLVAAAVERLTRHQAANEHERDAIAAGIAGWREVGRG